MVTGGAGYIGSVVAGRLLADGFAVRVIDNLTFGGDALLGLAAHRDFEFIRGDLRNTSDVAAAVSGVHGIVHLAAIVGDPACKSTPALAKEVNGDAAQLLLESAIGAGVQRFVFSSTCSNYGKMPDADGFVDEESELRPVSLYAELKVAFERQLLSLDHSAMTATALRFATAYGLSPRPRFDLTVNEFTRDLCLGRELEIFGEQFWRPYAHVSDLAAACSLTLRADPALVAGQAFNVGDNNENYQKKTLVDMILKRLPETAELVKYVKRDEDPRDYRVRFDKIQDTLGFGVTRTVPDGIAETVAAIRSGLIADPFDGKHRNS